MAYVNEAIMPLLRQRGIGDIGGGGLPVQGIPDQMREAGAGRLRWLNRVNTPIMAQNDTRGVIQKLRDVLSGREAQIDETTQEQPVAQPAATGGEATQEVKPSKAYTWEYEGKTYLRDTNNRVWVMGKDGAWEFVRED